MEHEETMLEEAPEPVESDDVTQVSSEDSDSDESTEDTSNDEEF